jgi:hypothetical protein
VNAPYRDLAVSSPRRKTHRRYLAYRVYAAATLFGWFWLMATHPRDPRLLFAALPLFLPALLMVFSWAGFPWPYSIFGALERTPFPREMATLTVGPTSARIGYLSLNGPFVRFTVMPSGVGIAITGGVKAFVPLASITGLTGGGWLGSSIEHACPEVRRPIRFWSRELHDALAAMRVGQPGQ